MYVKAWQSFSIIMYVKVWQSFSIYYVINSNTWHTTFIAIILRWPLHLTNITAYFFKYILTFRSSITCSNANSHTCLICVLLTATCLMVGTAARSAHCGVNSIISRVPKGFSRFLFSPCLGACVSVCVCLYICVCMYVCVLVCGHITHTYWMDSYETSCGDSGTSCLLCVTINRIY